MLPPVPCKAIAKPLLEVNSFANQDIAAGCQKVMATLSKEENTTAVQKPLASPNATANTDTKIMDPPSMIARCFGYWSPINPAGILANPLIIARNVDSVPI